MLDKSTTRFTSHAGPGFSLTFSLGNCTFDEKALLSKDGSLECFGPSVALQKTPLTYTSAYRQAASFTGEVRSIRDLCIPELQCSTLSIPWRMPVSHGCLSV